MKTKNLVLLAGTALVLGVAAVFTGRSGRIASGSSLNGTKVLPKLSVADVARIEIGGSKKLTLSAGEKGWTIDAWFGYPADVTKIRENLLKLADLKVGQIAKGTVSKAETPVELKGADGKSLGTLKLGDQHFSKPRGQMAMFGGGGYPDGRYLTFDNQVVLVNDALDAFDGDPAKWCDQQLCETPYIRFNTVVDPKLEGACGFATGVVCKVTYKGNTNAVGKVGGTVKNGTDRYFRIEGEKWIYTIASYTADSLVKPKDEPKKKAEPKKAESKATSTAKPAAKPLAKPAVKPADKPAAKPAPKPASARK